MHNPLRRQTLPLQKPLHSHQPLLNLMLARQQVRPGLLPKELLMVRHLYRPHQQPRVLLILQTMKLVLLRKLTREVPMKQLLHLPPLLLLHLLQVQQHPDGHGQTLPPQHLQDLITPLVNRMGEDVRVFLPIAQVDVPAGHGEEEHVADLGDVQDVEGLPRSLDELKALGCGGSHPHVLAVVSQVTDLLDGLEQAVQVCVLVQLDEADQLLGALDPELFAGLEDFRAERLVVVVGDASLLVDEVLLLLVSELDVLVEPLFF